MLIIADSIPKELQRIIEFLNEQMTPAEILGLEIKQFVGQGNIKTLVPRVIGQTVSADITKGVNKSGDSHWTEETFFAELLNQRGQQEAEAARKIFDWIKPKVTYFYYGVGKRGSFAPILKTKDISRFCFAIWTDGLIEIYFQHMKGRLPFDKEEKRKELLNMLNSIKGVSIPEDRLSARPSFPISLLTDKFEMKKFIDAFNWYWNEQQL